MSCDATEWVKAPFQGDLSYCKMWV